MLIWVVLSAYILADYQLSIEPKIQKEREDPEPHKAKLHYPLSILLSEAALICFSLLKKHGTFISLFELCFNTLIKQGLSFGFMLFHTTHLLKVDVSALVSVECASSQCIFLSKLYHMLKRDHFQ